MNERDQEILGKALGRAVDSQIARETPFESSRLATELTRRRPSPLLVAARFAGAIAALVLLVGLGAFVARNRVEREPAASPQPSAEVVEPSPVPVATPGKLDQSIVYCARNGVPPFGFHVDGAGSGATPEERIKSRLRELEKLKPLGPSETGTCPFGWPSPARIATVSVQGDLATLDYSVPGDDWRHSAKGNPLIKEIVYTASEEPGIRRVMVTQNGGKTAVIGNGVGTPSCGSRLPGQGVSWCGPFTREGSLALGVAASTEPIINGDDRSGRPIAQIRTEASVDQVAPGLARFTVRIVPAMPDPRFFPNFSAQVRQNDERANPDGSKWTLELRLPAADDELTGIKTIDRTPLRSIRTVRGSPLTYQLALDDLRPWRVAVLFDPVRLVVDIGAPLSSSSSNLVVYSPCCALYGERVLQDGSRQLGGVPIKLSSRTITLSGMARAFEANVPWTVWDSSKVIASGAATASIGTSPVWGGFEATIELPAGASGELTLQVFLASPKDGTLTDLVTIPLAAP